MVFIIRFAAFAIFHSLGATNWFKNRFCGHLRWYRLLYNLLSVAMFIYVMAAWRNSNVIYFVPGAASLIMYLLQLVTGILVINCLRSTGIGSFAGIVNETKKDSFVQNGWYGKVRHPLYLFSMAFLMLNPVVTEQWMVLTICSVFYFIVGALIEERRLVEIWGNDYKEYQKRVPFFIPDLHT